MTTRFTQADLDVYELLSAAGSLVIKFFDFTRHLNYVDDNEIGGWGARGHR